MEPGQQLGPPQITEEDLASSGPGVRALVISRLEAMWEPIRLRLHADKEEGMPLDPRLLEIGIRICKELAMHYRLYRPPATKPDDEEEVLGAGVDRAALIEGQLTELEQRHQGQR
jgi:hypothetical protein